MVAGTLRNFQFKDSRMGGGGGGGGGGVGASPPGSYTHVNVCKVKLGNSQLHASD